MALPSRVIEVDGESAWVDSAGVQRRVSLLLLDEAVAVGDYLLIQAGGFAYQRLDAASARQTLELIDQVVGASAGADLRAW